MIHPNIGFDGPTSAQIAAFWGDEEDERTPWDDLADFAAETRTIIRCAVMQHRAHRLGFLLGELRDKALDVIEDHDYPHRLAWLRTVNALRRQVRHAMARAS